MAAWIDIFYGEGGGSVRAKINDAMNYLFGAIQNYWEIVEGVLKPKDDLDVEIGNLTTNHHETNTWIAGGNVRVDEGDLYIDDIAAPGLLPESLFIFPSGRVATMNEFVTYELQLNFLLPNGSQSTIGGIVIINNIQTVSIIEGVANFPMVPDDTHSLHILPAGFRQMTVPVTIDGENKQKYITLVPEYGDTALPTQTVTFVIQKPAGSSPSPPEGFVTLFIGDKSVSKFLAPVGSDGHAVFEGVPQGTHDYIFMPHPIDMWETITGSVTVSMSPVTVTLTLYRLNLRSEQQAIQGVGAVYITEGSEANLEPETPTVVVATGANFDLMLPHPFVSEGAEVRARKDTAGGALTLHAEEGFILNGAEGDVITTTVAGAWVVAKVMLVSGSLKWVVVTDSGNWELDVV